MKQNKSFKIGITGDTGSGKSTVAKIFVERGFHLVDADLISRKVIDKNPDLILFIKSEFGERFIERGKLNRKEFGKYLFSNIERKKVWENAILPLIINDIKNEIELFNNKKIVLDAPTLIENNLHVLMDINILVVASRETKIERASVRDGLDPKIIEERLNSQMKESIKEKYVDFVIRNDGTKREIELKVLDLISRIGGI